MKTWILAAVMMVGMTMAAQGKRDGREPLKPEQRTELAAKKMTLALNLNDKQQKDVKALLTARSVKMQQMMAQHKADKAAGKKPTADERFAMKSKMLDEKIAMKAEMKKILTAEQFDKWEKTAEERKARSHRKHRTGEHGRRK